MMPRPGMAAGRVLLAGILICYPLAVYLLLDSVGAGVLGIVLILLLVFRLNKVTEILPGRVFFVAVAIAVAGIIALLGGGAMALKFYPTLVSLLLLLVFGYTVFVPPSMVERLVRLAGKKFSSRTVPYTRGVTILWCLFFAFNAVVTASITLSGSMEAWTLYNGLIAYLIVGTLFAAEAVFRYFYKRHHQLSSRTK